MSYLTEPITKTGVMSHAACNRELYFRVQGKMDNSFLCIRFLQRLDVNKKNCKIELLSYLLNWSVDTVEVLSNEACDFIRKLSNFPAFLFIAANKLFTK